MKKNSIKTIVFYIVILPIIAWIAIGWIAFQFNNPICNDSAFYTDFVSVLTFKTLPEYQLKGE